MADQPITQHFAVQKDSNKRSKVKHEAITAVKAEQSTSKSLPQAKRDYDLEILREFDLNWEFGPCTGISRLERWNRAQKHGLNPPENIKNLLSENHTDKEYIHGVWKDYQI